jgi:hypothetical protein
VRLFCSLCEVACAHHNSTALAVAALGSADKVDRTPFLAHSVPAISAWGSLALRKALLILAAVVLAPMLVVGLSAFAAGEWRNVGQTDGGDKISVSSVRILKSNQRTALVRVQYKEPTELPQGGPFVEMRARVRFNCASGVVAPTSVWFYSMDHGGRFVVSKKATRDDQFGKAPEGGFATMISQSVCSQTN